jgi:feruloyl-CoA synthase
MPAREVVRHPQAVRRFRSILDRLARQSTGSSTFVARAMLLDEPPSLDAREITDKGSLNQKVVLANRAALVEELYAAVPSSHVLVATPAAQR